MLKCSSAGKTQESIALGNELTVLNGDSTERENASVYSQYAIILEAATASITKQRMEWRECRIAV